MLPDMGIGGAPMAGYPAIVQDARGRPNDASPIIRGPGGVVLAFLAFPRNGGSEPKAESAMYFSVSPARRQCLANHLVQSAIFSDHVPHRKYSPAENIARMHSSDGVDL